MINHTKLRSGVELSLPSSRFAHPVFSDPGTLEEFFEVLSWRTLGLHSKPIVIIDQGGYWQPLAGLLRSVVEGGFADRAHLDVVAFIEDLNADSLDLVEFAMGLEEKFDVKIADEDLAKIKTVQDAVDAII